MLKKRFFFWFLFCVRFRYIKPSFDTCEIAKIETFCFWTKFLKKEFWKFFSFCFTRIFLIGKIEMLLLKQQRKSFLDGRNYVIEIVYFLWIYPRSQQHDKKMKISLSFHRHPSAKKRKVGQKKYENKLIKKRSKNYFFILICNGIWYKFQRNDLTLI